MTCAVCPEGTECTCWFYRDWTLCWPPLGSVADQLRRRRAAALRSPRLACDRRDPLSRSCR